MQNKEKIKLIAGVLILSGVLLGIYFTFSPKNITGPETPLTQTEQTIDTNTTENTDPAPTAQSEIKQDLATLEINGVSLTTSIEKNTSVYDFMNKLKKERKVNFTDKTYIGLGKFIDSINGIRGDGTRFWIYYVDGQKAQIGVSNYKINPGDVVSWKYEKDIN